MRRRLPMCVRRFGFVPLASALLACGSQVDTDYRGEPMATLRGVVATSASLESVPEVSAAIVWNATDPRYIGERVAVDGDFPSSFSLQLYGPPPPEAEVRTMADYCLHADGQTITSGSDEPCDGQAVPAGTGLGFSVGLLAAIDTSVPDGEISREDIAGIDVDHVIFYADHDRPLGELGSMPTAKQLAQKAMLASFDYPQPYEAGYHLGRQNPEVQALRREQNDCLWEGLCVYWMRDEDLQDYSDWEFERCQERFPDNPTCEAYAKHLADGEPASSTECRELYESLADRNDCGFSYSVPPILEAPEGLDDPITIQLGLGFWDAE
jgi:hypothetical protein